MKKNKVTGLSIAVVDDKGVIWADGFGYADKEKNIKATADTIYRAASLSKLFTATAVMQLAEQNRIDIDEPLNTYLPDFSIKSRFPDKSQITPRNLMSHHSGLPYNYYKGIFSKRPESFTGLLAKIKNEYLAYPPDSVYSYSNLGITILGAMIERISGNTFSKHMDESILHPLGMNNSSFIRKEEMHVAKGYKEGRRTEDFEARDLPASGLLSSAMDIGKFMQMFLAKGRWGAVQLLKPETISEMLRPQNTDVALDNDIYVGLGWALDGMGDLKIEGAGPVAHHGGALPFFNSQLLMLPEERIGVVVLTNSSTRPAVDKVAAEALALTLEARTGIKRKRNAPVYEQRKSVSREEMEAYAGYYATQIGLLKTYPESDSLKVDIFGHPINLIPREDGRLRLQYKLLELIPISLGEILDRVGIGRTQVGNRDLLTTRSQYLDMVFGEKITPSAIPEPWLRRIGSYEITNADDDVLFFDDVRLLVRDGFLVVEYFAPLIGDERIGFPVSAVSENEAVILGIGNGMRETIRTYNDNGEEYLQYSGYRFRKRTE
ncbi:MAG TPA: serine hydrolase domain-containing protein [Syntrophorhabdaceae bacterium]|nr:serine hydrolase domain-containing protein [Syntrophorhabdaceae bacterium]